MHERVQVIDPFSYSEDGMKEEKSEIFESNDYESLVGK